MVGFLTGVLILLIIVYFIILIARMAPAIIDDEETVETTTTATTAEEHQGLKIAGELKRQFTEGTNPQPFVIDPVDQAKTFVNTKDDMYEDADNKIWKLV